MPSQPARRKYAWRMIVAVLLGLVILAGGIWMGIFFWKQAAIRNRAETAKLLARQLLVEGRPEDAARLLAVTRAPAPDTPAGKEWLELEAETAIGTRQLDRLERIYRSNPQLFATNHAVIEWLQRYSLDNLGRLDPDLPSTPAHPLLVAEQLLLEGDRPGAILALENSVLDGRNEINRHLRLAALKLPDLASAWKHVQKAYALDPRSVDVRLVAGRLLEEGGKFQEAGREYAAAYFADPGNPVTCSLLANYHLKSSHPERALDVWRRFPRQPGPFSPDVDFWELVLGQSSGEKKFWSEDEEARVDPDDPKPPLPIFWRRILEALEKGNENLAKSRLSIGTPRPEGVTTLLGTHLDALLAIRGGTRVSRGAFTSARSNPHPLFEWLAENEADAGALSSPWVIPTLFAAHGWAGAANLLARNASLGDAPGWAVWTLAHAAMRSNDAEQFTVRSSLRPEDPAILLLVAENDIARGTNRDTALKSLEWLAGDLEVGPRAVRALVLARLADGDTDGAATALAVNPLFASSVAGRELAARIALARGDEAAADALFASLENESEEARVHLARKAFLAGDLERAETLTRQLANSRPDNMVYVENLQKIEAAKINAAMPAKSTP